MDYLAVFLLGLVLGSFYNVLIYRLPRNVSVVFPSSHCPECKHRISWYDNIPIVSYLILRGRCRHCGAKISLQYPLVELSSGLLALYSYYKWGLSPEALIYYAFFSALLVASLIDLKFFILPDVITLPGIVLGLGSSFLRSDITPVQSVVGALTGFAIPFAIYIYYVKLRKMEGLGFGDVKLLAFIGSVTGVYGVFTGLFLGSLFGLVFALPSIVRNRNTQFVIPFGPFISLGCFVGVVFKERILSFFTGSF
ncbi:prepilin peptidase [Hydrogenivirga sp.]